MRPPCSCSSSLKENGHVTDIAGDGETGSPCPRGGYDVLIVDRMLPRLDGLSLIE